MVVDPNDYLTHEIYFTACDKVQIFSSLGQELSEADSKNFVARVNLFDYLKDVDFFTKTVEQMEQQRGSEIGRIERGGEVQEEGQEEQVQSEVKVTNYQYLKKNLLPVLEGALKQVDLLRPEDPLAFIALYCLKNREKL